MTDVTQLLNALERGDPHAAEELLPLVYQELRKLAAQRMAHEQPGQTLQPTALAAGETILSLGEPCTIGLRNRPRRPTSRGAPSSGASAWSSA